MAESAVSFVVEKLYNLLIEEATFLQGVHDQVESMQMELRQMRAFLRDAEYNSTESESVANIVKEVREIAYGVEDVVDTYILRMHRQQRRRGFLGFVKKYGCFLCRLHSIGKQIEQINASIQKISEMRSRYGIGDHLGGGSKQTVSEVDKIVQERRALALEREMNASVGFEDDMGKIVETLLDADKKKPQRCVISIIGMGGAGKTTLARRICGRPDVMRSFDGCALVTVSQTWDLRKIFEDIALKFSGLNKEQLQKMDEGGLKERVLTCLQGKRYLIVLDDMWRIDVWPLISAHLPDQKNGSRVIITTREMEVARSADPTTEPYPLRSLREDESWELFTKIVFSGDDELAQKECTGELKELSKKILKSCGGLPLAIILMGGLLATREKRPLVWLDVLEGFSWAEVPGGQVFEKVQALSYKDLPHHLKPCFLYLSVFPEDYVIDAERLIRLWVAEGFVPNQEDVGRRRSNQSSTDRTMEEIAEGWLEELVNRCLVQVAERAPSGRLLRCRMHDVLRDLSFKEACKAIFFHTWREQQQVAASTRRLVVQGGMLQLEHCAPKLRTLLDFSNGGLASPQLLTSWRLLRVLDLRLSGNLQLPPEATGDLIHLRYLGLTAGGGVTIPSSVGRLQNLQTLALVAASLSGVPDSMWGIRTLRHVWLDGGDVEPPNNTIMISSQLVNLQTLATVTAGSWIASRLEAWTTLRVLFIKGISPDHHLALSNSLGSLVHLRRLSLESDEQHLLPRKALALPNLHRLEEVKLVGRLINKIGQDDDDAYTSDEMPPNLTELHLSGSCLQQDPFKLLEKLSYLKRLVLTGASECEEAVCTAGGFPELEELMLEDALGPSRRWTVVDAAMPHIRRLTMTIVDIDSDSKYTLSTSCSGADEGVACIAGQRTNGALSISFGGDEEFDVSWVSGAERIALFQ